MGKKIINIIKMIKNNKRFKYTLVVTIMLLFISIIGYSLSFFDNNNSALVANIKVNDLLFNMTTNSGESDDRILRLQAGKKESFYIKLKNLNNMNVKYELKYSVCSDNNCTTSYSTLPNNVSVFVMPNSEEHINGEIATDESDIVEIELLTVNSNSEDVYIKLDLNAGYAWNNLVLENQFEVISSEERNHNINIDILAYVDGIIADEYPRSCNYRTELKAYNSENVEIPISSSGLSCDRNTNTWKMTIDVLVKKVVINFIYRQGAPAFTYTGVSRIENGESSTEWKIYFLTSGELTFTEESSTIDAFLVGGGGGGGTGFTWYNRWGETNMGGGGGGGAGGYGLITNNILISKNITYNIVIGAGGQGSAGKNGTANTGGGGGGGGAPSAAGTTKGGTGGSGIVVIRSHKATE